MNGSRAAVSPAAVVCPVAGSIPANLCDSVTNGSKLATPVPAPTVLTVPKSPKVTVPAGAVAPELFPVIVSELLNDEVVSLFDMPVVSLCFLNSIN